MAELRSWDRDHMAFKERPRQLLSGLCRSLPTLSYRKNNSNLPEKDYLCEKTDHFLWEKFSRHLRLQTVEIKWKSNQLPTMMVEQRSDLSDLRKLKSALNIWRDCLQTFYIRQRSATISRGRETNKVNRRLSCFPAWWDIPDCKRDEKFQAGLKK